MSNAEVPSLCTPSQHDQLHRIEDIEELIQLRDLYRKDWPTNCIGFYTLQNYCSWLTAQQREQLKNLHIYSLNGEWRSDGLYLIVHCESAIINFIRASVGSLSTFFNTLHTANNDQDRVDTALKLLNWEKGSKITAIPRRYIETVTALVQSLNYGERRARLNIFYLPRAKALELQVDCPPGFRLHRLRLDDAPLVNGLWENRNPGSLFFIKLVIEHNISMALSTADTDELIAWCTRCQSGCLGTLKVKIDYLRRGFASLVVKAFAREVAAAGDDVLALVHEHNEASKALFSKLSFVVLDNVFHMKASPDNKFVEWPEDE